jgi:hypothetical protein
MVNKEQNLIITKYALKDYYFNLLKLHINMLFKDILSI